DEVRRLAEQVTESVSDSDIRHRSKYSNGNQKNVAYSMASSEETSSSMEEKSARSNELAKLAADLKDLCVSLNYKRIILVQRYTISGDRRDEASRVVSAGSITREILKQSHSLRISVF